LKDFVNLLLGHNTSAYLLKCGLNLQQRDTFQEDATMKIIKRRARRKINE